MCQGLIPKPRARSLPRLKCAEVRDDACEWGLDHRRIPSRS